MATKCITRPLLRFKGTIQKPTTSANAVNDHAELDLRDDANWDDVSPVRFAMKPRRSSEINAVDQTEGVLLSKVETHGTTTTRQAQLSWRLVYVDRDGVTHRLNFTGKVVSDDGTWVTFDCQEEAN